MTAASLTFEVQHTNQQAKTGVLRHARGHSGAPDFYQEGQPSVPDSRHDEPPWTRRPVLHAGRHQIVSNRGSPLFLTPDMMSHLGPEGQCYILEGTKL